MLTSLSTYGYLVVFLYSLGGGMVAIIAAGVLAHLGKMDITVSIVLAAAIRCFFTSADITAPP